MTEVAVFGDAKAFCDWLQEILSPSADETRWPVIDCRQIESGRHLAVLRGSGYKVRAVYERGEVEFGVGPLSAPSTWREHREWFSLHDVVKFMRQDKSIQLHVSQPELGKIPSLEEVVEGWRDHLLNGEEELRRFFSGDVAAEQRRALESFQEELDAEAEMELRRFEEQDR